MKNLSPKLQILSTLNLWNVTSKFMIVGLFVFVHLTKNILFTVPSYVCDRPP